MSNIAKIHSQLSVTNVAIDKRIAMINIPEVQDALTQIEKNIFLLTTKTQIRSIEKNKLYSDLEKLSKFLVRDIGLKTELDQYDLARFFDIVSRYFSELSFPEIKIAFEMAMIGELDHYLPKNGNGEPDKSHYQSFSFEYITKILTAYRKKRSVVLNKAYIAIPVLEQKADSDYINKLSNLSLQQLRKIALLYKYTGILEFKGVEEKLMYDRLLKSGFANKIVVSGTDNEVAMAKLIQSALLTTVQKHEISNNKNHERVQFTGYIIARRKEIVRALDYCNKMEIQIKDYIL